MTSNSTEYAHNYYETHKKEWEGYSNKRRKEKRNEIRQQHKEWYMKVSRKASTRFSNLKAEAKRRDLEVDFTLEQYKELIIQSCYYCGVSLLDKTGCSLDRIDNSKSYSINNVLPCCGNCNQTRGDRWSVEETKIMIQAALKFREIQSQ